MKTIVEFNQTNKEHVITTTVLDRELQTMMNTKAILNQAQNIVANTLAEIIISRMDIQFKEEEVPEETPAPPHHDYKKFIDEPAGDKLPIEFRDDELETGG